MWHNVQISTFSWVPVKIFCMFTKLLLWAALGKAGCGYSMEDVTLPCRATLGPGRKVVCCFIVIVFANKDMGDLQRNC